MKIKKVIHENVEDDGKLGSGDGEVITESSIRISDGCGCGEPSCHCSEGYWISISLPRDPISKRVEVVIVKFDNKEEMDRFFKEKELIGTK